MRVVGLEPTATRLKGAYSTTELHPRDTNNVSCLSSNSPIPGARSIFARGFQGDRLARQAAYRRVSPGALSCHPERSEGSDVPGTEILRCAQDDRPGWQEPPRRSPCSLWLHAPRKQRARTFPRLSGTFSAEIDLAC